jgi:regulator of RNase E activity RraA
MQERDSRLGDNDGVQTIPKDLVDEALQRAERIFGKESEDREALAAGTPIAGRRARPRSRT